MLDFYGAWETDFSLLDMGHKHIALVNNYILAVPLLQCDIVPRKLFDEKDALTNEVKRNFAGIKILMRLDPFRELSDA
ncbi:hypothetical protein PUN28_000791 [Cardiocondyla obscurior]|uniref:Uncharacterized protein n=1 Tax=Cardiocondyla obscurior TaxID=286306 RepID=A0AAW2H124_9HYME